MKFFGILICGLCFSMAASEGYFPCSENEIAKDCKTPCQPTCQTPYTPSCNLLTCQPGCVCRPGTIRDEMSGKCVNVQDCHTAPCWWYEVQNQGRNACERTCQNQPLGICILQKKRCVCKPGLLRDLNSGKCVPYERCPKVQCGENEEWRSCTNPLSRETCQNRFNKSESRPTTCIPGCECKKGLIWDEDSESCVSEYQCPTICGENQTWRKCNDGAWTETCQRRKIKTNSKVCMAGCSCKDGYLWDENYNKCVPREHCSRVCRENEEWCKSVSNNVATCQNILKPQCSKHYLEVPFVSPKSGCICKEGFIWNEIVEKCVVLEDCPNIFPTASPRSYGTSDYSSTVATEPYTTIIPSNATSAGTNVSSETPASTLNTLSGSVSTALTSDTESSVTNAISTTDKGTVRTTGTTPYYINEPR